MIPPLKVLLLFRFLYFYYIMTYRNRGAATVMGDEKFEGLFSDFLFRQGMGLPMIIITGNFNSLKHAQLKTGKLHRNGKRRNHPAGMEDQAIVTITGNGNRISRKNGKWKEPAMIYVFPERLHKGFPIPGFRLAGSGIPDFLPGSEKPHFSHRSVAKIFV
jgi:hypothetical protein